ncbi:hypothetical protein QQ045_007804 [Rhodiola kirilowii]
MNWFVVVGCFDVVGTLRRAVVDALAQCSGRGEDGVVPQLAHYLHNSLPWTSSEP